MMMTRFAMAMLGLALATHAQAQQIVRTLDQDTVRIAPRHPLIRVGKWLALGGAGGAAGYGIAANRDADRRYARLERLCDTTPDRCERQSAGGPFTDAALEREYQDILDLDRRAKVALVAGQIAVAASVALFILDLPRGGKGEDIPYEPPRLRLNLDPLGRLSLQYNFYGPGRR